MNSTSIFDWVHLMAGNVWLYGGAFLLVLGILVFVHEWGHYSIARLCGVRIESFSIGFGPELFGRTAKNGTRWKVSLVPLGGYVKMFGDTDPASAGHSGEVKEGDTIRPLTETERAVAFFAQPVWKRAAIVIAGPAVNFLFAIVVLTSLYTFYGEPVTPAIAAAIMGGSAAEQAGFQPHDQIVAIDNITINRFEDIKREVMLGLDTPRDFTVLRDGRKLVIHATPRRSEDKDRFGFKHASGTLGLISQGNGIDITKIIALNGQPVKDVKTTRAFLTAHMGQRFFVQLGKDPKTDILILQPLIQDNVGLNDPKSADYNHLGMAKDYKDVFERHPFPIALRDALREVSDVIVSTLKALGQMITGIRSPTELGGIIRIGAMAGDMAKAGAIALISFAGLLSINLGLVNLFPVPMLDGGHLLFYAIEAVKGSPIPDRVQEYAFRVGLTILVGIMLFANINDLVQLIL